MVILSCEVSHDSVTDRRSRLQDNIRSHGDDTLVFSEREFQTPKHSGGLSVEYEQDCCHFVLSEIKIGDDEASWWVEY